MSSASSRRKLDFYLPWRACALQHYWAHLGGIEAIALEIKQKADAGGDILSVARATEMGLTNDGWLYIGNLSWSGVLHW